MSSNDVVERAFTIWLFGVTRHPVCIDTSLCKLERTSPDEHSGSMNFFLRQSSGGIGAGGTNSMAWKGVKGKASAELVNLTPTVELKLENNIRGQSGPCAMERA